MVSRTSVNRWVHTFLEEGLEGLKEKPRTGRLHGYGQRKEHAPEP
ncbi:helix-turn-helix domain-containing protein [Vibrio cidicii]|nr:helix-turn-helix domain-containing protein [Vibrio cidicii]